MFDLVFFHHFFALDHAAAAIWALVLALLPGGAAARTGLIIFYLGAGDLPAGLCLLLGSKAGSSDDPADETQNNENRTEDNGAKD